MKVAIGREYNVRMTSGSLMKTAITLRWLVRIFCGGVAIFFMAGWITSYLFPLQFFINAPKHDYVCVEFTGGRISFAHASDVGGGNSWQFDLRKGHEGEWEWLERSSKVHFLGFVYYHPSIAEWCHTIPFWFPTLLSAILVWLAWRKTRPVRRGFPVEAPIRNNSSSTVSDT